MGDRTSNKKTKRSGSDAEAKDTFMGGDRAQTTKKRKRKVADHDSMRYDEGEIFQVKGMSALNLILDEAASNVEARKAASSDSDSGSGSGSESKGKTTTQPKMKHAKSAMDNGSSSSSKKKKKKDKITTQPKMKHAK